MCCFKLLAQNKVTNAEETGLPQHSQWLNSDGSWNYFQIQNGGYVKKYIFDCTYHTCWDEINRT